MRPESIEKYENVKVKRAQGMTFEDACKSEKMSTMTYYKVRDLQEKAPKKERKPYTKKAKYIDFHGETVTPTVETKTRVAVIICDLAKLSEVLGGLK